ncbi:hypothetical protein HRbin16_02189 [bacterium HR16]|nr:hypothetical protein HRbin16_02189 [bacterium HR16]
MRLHEGRDEKKINEATMSISERFLYEAIRIHRGAHLRARPFYLGDRRIQQKSPPLAQGARVRLLPYAFTRAFSR